VKVLLRNPRREVDVPGPATVNVVLERLEIPRESVIVIRGDELVPGDAVLAADDVVEVRPVISGGAVDREGAA
jgi:sulfur carrier protein